VSRYTCSTRLNVWRQAGAWKTIEELLRSSDHVRRLNLEAADPTS
jgi:hypothetical protein